MSGQRSRARPGRRAAGEIEFAAARSPPPHHHHRSLGRFGERGRQSSYEPKTKNRACNKLMKGTAKSGDHVSHPAAKRETLVSNCLGKNVTATH